MKTCLLILGSLVIFAFAPAMDHPAKTVFYFCVSKPVDHNTREKQTILYSGVHQLQTDDAAAATKVKAAQWGTWVSSRCASKAGCTSDLNYYTTREEAKTAYTQMLQTFSDTTKFLLKKVKFQ